MAIETPALVLLALLVLTLPLNWLLAAMMAAAFHELCHYLAILALGGRVAKLRLGAGGAVMEVSALTPGREILAALAGPTGGLLLSLLWPRFPRIVLCALVQSFFNLIPVRPLDGGRALYGMLTLLRLQQWQGRVEAVLLCMGLLLTGVKGMSIFAIWILVRVLLRKIPCKVRLPGVQ